VEEIVFGDLGERRVRRPQEMQKRMTEVCEFKAPGVRMGLCEREVFVNADSAARQMIVEKAQVVNPEPWIVGDMGCLREAGE